MAEEEVEGFDERRRAGLEMQAQLPPPSRHPEDPPVFRRLDRVAGAAEGGCLLVELGPIGLFVGGMTTIMLILKKRRRSAR